MHASVLSPKEAATVREEARQIVADAAKDALAAPRPDPDAIESHVVAVPHLPDPPGRGLTGRRRECPGNLRVAR